MEGSLWPLGAYAALVVALIGGMLGLSHVLGERHREPGTTEPYESGVPPTRTAPPKPTIAYYLVAIFFVIFDLEAAFLFAWAVAAPALGWAGYLTATVFIGLLVITLAYVWGMGGLD